MPYASLPLANSGLYHFAIIRLYHKYNTFLNYVSHSLRITKLERIVETPIVVASWSEERMACQLLNLQLVYEVR